MNTRVIQPPMRVIFWGTPQFAVPSFQRLVDHVDFDVLAVVTQPDKRRGRGNQVMPSPVKAVAVEHNIPVWQPKRVKQDAETLALLEAAQADVFVVVAYGQILSQQILDMPRLGCINGHGSILPKYRGAAPIQWCLYHGETETGMTTMQMDAGMDTGPMLLTARSPIELLDNSQDLAMRLADLSAELILATLPQLVNGTLQPQAQNPDEATYAPLIKKSDFGLDWEKSAIALHNQTRGFYPNCTATFRGESLKVIATVPCMPELWAQLPEPWRSLETDVQSMINTPGQPGEVMAIAKGLGPLVQTGSGLLLLRDVQLAGKKAQSGTDFANGMRVSLGEILGNG
jgi:methionyl-tRNA formyltransferase